MKREEASLATQSTALKSKIEMGVLVLQCRALKDVEPESPRWSPGEFSNQTLTAGRVLSRRLV
jgi:hypothetical protein